VVGGPALVVAVGLKPVAADADGHSMPAPRRLFAPVTALVALAACGMAPSASFAAKKPKPKPQLKALMTNCGHVLWTDLPQYPGESLNGVHMGVRVTFRGKPLGGVALTSHLTGPDVRAAGGRTDGVTAGSDSDAGMIDASVPMYVGADGTYTLSWTVTKKGYKPDKGRVTFAAVTGEEMQGVACEGWTQPRW
jgi:hypothetical protein